MSYCFLSILSEEDIRSLGHDKPSFEIPPALGKSRRGVETLQERQTSIIVSGFDESHWHGYAFGSFGISGDTEESGIDGDDDAAYESDDFFVTGGSENNWEPLVMTAGPRVYFLRAVRYRLEAIVKEQDYLVHVLQTKMKDHVSSQNERYETHS